MSEATDDDNAVTGAKIADGWEYRSMHSAIAYVLKYITKSMPSMGWTESYRRYNRSQEFPSAKSCDWRALSSHGKQIVSRYQYQSLYAAKQAAKHRRDCEAYPIAVYGDASANASAYAAEYERRDRRYWPRHAAWLQNPSGRWDLDLTDMDSQFYRRPWDMQWEDCMRWLPVLEFKSDGAIMHLPTGGR